MQIETLSGWNEVLKACQVTSSKYFTGEIKLSPEWKRRILLAEHSPIRCLIFSWTWKNIPYWVSVQLTRHKIGIEHFVSSSRSDKTGIDRGELSQSSPVDHKCIANAQTIINISKERLCRNASKETTKAWVDFLIYLYKVEPELHNICVQKCIYRGFCPEMKPCGFHKTITFKEELALYRKWINE